MSLIRRVGCERCERGKPVPAQDVSFTEKWRADDVPYVFERRDAVLPRVPSAVQLEARYGEGLRRVEEYQGMSAFRLRTLLSMRVAACIAEEEWVPCPVRVTRKTVTGWIDKYGGAWESRCQGTQTSRERPGVSSQDPAQVEALLGVRLRRYLALGFRGHREFVRYASTQGVTVGDACMRTWLQVYGNYFPEAVLGRKRVWGILARRSTVWRKA